MRVGLVTSLMHILDSPRSGRRIDAVTPFQLNGNAIRDEYGGSKARATSGVGRTTQGRA